MELASDFSKRRDLVAAVLRTDCEDGRMNMP
jgi:hypothetical protein